MILIFKFFSKQQKNNLSKWICLIFLSKLFINIDKSNFILIIKSKWVSEKNMSDLPNNPYPYNENNGNNNE